MSSPYNFEVKESIELPKRQVADTFRQSRSGAYTFHGLPFDTVPVGGGFEVEIDPFCDEDARRKAISKIHTLVVKANRMWGPKHGDGTRYFKSKFDANTCKMVVRRMPLE